MTTYVFSRTLEALPEGADGELVREDAAEFVRRLKARAGRRHPRHGRRRDRHARCSRRAWSTRSGSASTRCCSGAAFRPSGRWRGGSSSTLIEARPIANECVAVR